MSQVSRIEAVVTSDVDERNTRLLRDDELDAVSGGKAGGDQQNYMIVTMSDCLISSF
jgi:hypothetical protein